MGAIDGFLRQIRQAIYGREVRESIAKGIEQCYSDATDVVKVSDTPPTGENVKLWVKPEPDEFQVPTWAEHQEVADDVEELKSVIKFESTGEHSVSSEQIIQGGYNTYDTNRIRVKGRITVYKGQKISFVSGTSTKQLRVGYFVPGGSYIKDSAWISGGSIVFDDEYDIVIMFRNGTDSAIVPSDYDATTKLFANWEITTDEIDNSLQFISSNLAESYTVVNGLYINTSGVLTAMDSGYANRTICIQAAPNKIYKIKKNTTTIMRAGCGASASLAAGTKLANSVKHSSASDGELITKTTESDTYIYVQLFADSDVSALQTIDANIGTLFVIEDISGEIETEKDTILVRMEHGKLSAGYTTSPIVDYTANVRTAFFIKTNGANKIIFNDIRSYKQSGFITLYFYNSSFEYIGYSDISISVLNEENIIANTSYIKFYFPYANNIDSVSITLQNANSSPVEIKNARVERADPYEFLTFKVGDSCGTARMMLPPNYSPTGEPVPMIYYLDGSGNFTVWNGGFTSSKIPYLEYLRDEGYAVLSIFGWDSKMYNLYSGCGAAYPYVTATCMKVIESAFNYVQSRYNIDMTDVHIMSKSQGGVCALYFATNPIIPFRSIGMFAPVLDNLSMPGESMYAGTRKALADDMDYSGDVEYYTSTDFLSYSDEAKAFWLANLPKISGNNPCWTALIGGTASERLDDANEDAKTFWTEEVWKSPSRDDIYTHKEYAKIAKVPVKIWGASDDNATPYLKMVEVVAQLQNGGSIAELETLPRGTGAHNCADAGSNIVASITTALGITHTNIPVGWVENIEWIRTNSKK